MLAIDFTEGGWLEGLQGGQSRQLQQLLDLGLTEEQAAEIWLSVPGSISTSGFGTTTGRSIFYANVKKEFISFVCGDPRYEQERAHALQAWRQHGKTGLVTIVAGFVRSTLGLAAVAVVPVIALRFTLLAKMGIGAFCASCSSEAHVEPGGS